MIINNVKMTMVFNYSMPILNILGLKINNILKKKTILCKIIIYQRLLISKIIGKIIGWKKATKIYMWIKAQRILNLILMKIQIQKSIKYLPKIIIIKIRKISRDKMSKIIIIYKINNLISKKILINFWITILQIILM